MLNATYKQIFMLNVVMLSVVMLGVVMLGIVAPVFFLSFYIFILILLKLNCIQLRVLT
jgi:hypothetical protein